MATVQLKVQGQIDSDGHLRLDLPTGLPAGAAEIAVTIAPKNGDGSHRYDFSQIAGRLKWAGNALEEQRGIRNEW
jgi:hypothetical protein